MRICWPGWRRPSSVAKGLTTAPVKVVVADKWYSHPQVLEWIREGHTVVSWSRMPQGFKADLILMPTAHRWNDNFWDYRGDKVITLARKNAKENE